MIVIEITAGAPKTCPFDNVTLSPIAPVARPIKNRITFATVPMTIAISVASGIRRFHGAHCTGRKLLIVLPPLAAALDAHPEAA